MRGREKGGLSDEREKEKEGKQLLTEGKRMRKEEREERRKD